jgi:hypothetical protein
MAKTTEENSSTADREPASAESTLGRMESTNPVPRVDLPQGHWTFLTNHAHVLILLSRSPSMVLREVALLVGITERAVQRIIADLEHGQFIQREKVGRQNRYRILTERHLRHPVEAHRTIGELIKLIERAD